MADTSTGCPGSEYFTALSRRLKIALTTWRRSHSTRRSEGTFATVDRDACRLGRPPHLVDGITDECRDGQWLASPAFLGFDDAEIEEILDDAREPLALADHALGEPSGHLGLAPRRDGLGEHGERADRRAQLVTDVGDEVAPHALDPAGLGDVAHERDRTTR